MKKWLIAIALVVCPILLTGCATLQVVSEQECQLVKTYEVNNMAKDVIFDKVIYWMAETYVSSKAVIEVKDKANGKIIGHGLTSFTNIYVPIPCKYTIIVDIKDNKIRLTFKDFIGMWGQFQNDPQPFTKWANSANLNEVKSKLEALSSELFKYIVEPETNSKEW